MTNTFLFILILFTFVSFPVRGDTLETTLPLYDQGLALGEVKVEVEGEKIMSIDKETLILALKEKLQEDTLKQFASLPSKINPQTLPLPIVYNPSELRLEMKIELSKRASEGLDVMEDQHQRYAGQAIRPAPFGGAINYRLEQNWTSHKLEEKYFSGQFDSFLNIKSFVLESQGYYQSNFDKKWFRGDTRLVKDVEKKQIRMQAGDIYPQVQGFMVPTPLGGLSVGRNFSLNPYRLPFPTESKNFSLSARSFVKYFVNGSLIKSEFLPAGNYTARDIPLNNGLNTIVIEATDDLGQRRVFVFRSASSINLLNQGESRFDLSYGTPFVDQNFKREYLNSEGDFFSGFYQYGFDTSFSASAYAQNQKNFSLLGSEMIAATVFGNLGAGHAYSLFPGENGLAQSLSYQYLGDNTNWYSSHSLTLRSEHRDEKFKTTTSDIPSIVQNVYSGNYTIPIANIMTVSIGANYGDVRNNSLENRYGYDSTLNMRLFDRHNLSLFVGRSRDEYKTWNNVAYLFLTITFPESNDFVSTFHDIEQKSTKVTYIKDNQNRIYAPRVQAVVEKNENYQLGEADITYTTPFADLGGRVNATHFEEQDSTLGRGSLRLNSAIVFAKNKEFWGMGLSRPVQGSFALIKPHERLKGQNIGLKSSSPFNEAQTGLWSEITYSNLLAYQYREMQLDPSMLEEGRALKQEKFVVFPTYRSAHLIHLEDKGAVMVKGQLKQASGEVWSLQVGKIGDKTFFTNRDGEFFIEGIEPGAYKIRLDNINAEVSLIVNEGETGIKKVGTIILEEEQ